MVFALAGHLTRFLDDLFSVSSAKTFVLVLLFLPLFKVGFSSYAGFVFGWSDVTSQDASDYAIVSDYVNRNAGAGDIVVGTSHMRRFVDAQNYSILTDSISADGVKVIYYNVLLPPERFFFNASYRNSRYLVLTPGTFEWLRNQSLSGMAEEVGGWPLVFNSSSFVVYENPSYNQPAFEDEQPPEYEEGH
jgi:hypothetical protein